MPRRHGGAFLCLRFTFPRSPPMPAAAARPDRTLDELLERLVARGWPRLQPNDCGWVDLNDRPTDTVGVWVLSERDDSGHEALLTIHAPRSWATPAGFESWSATIEIIDGHLTETVVWVVEMDAPPDAEVQHLAELCCWPGLEIVRRLVDAVSAASRPVPA